jgi:hypothetical protein
MELVLVVLVFYRFVLFYFGWMCNLCVFLLHAHLCWLASWWAPTMGPLSKIWASVRARAMRNEGRLRGKGPHVTHERRERTL